MEISETNSCAPVAPHSDCARPAGEDYGTLGPNPDVAPQDLDSSVKAILAQPSRVWPVVGVVAGVVLAVLALNVNKAHASWADFARIFTWHQTAAPPQPPAELSQLDQLQPQKQAETLLELAIGNTPGAVDQIVQRAGSWRGRLTWDSQIADLTSVALNAGDSKVREAGVEVELAAYGLARNSATVDLLIQQAESSAHARKIWALWALGLLANRGVESERAVEALRAHLRDADEDSRRWAVEGLGLAGTDATISTLLQTMHDDPSPLVRERAACSLAASGMLTHEQRLSAVPQLVNFSNDPMLDSQTHTWAFQALGDITKQRLPNDPAAWRDWYTSTQGK